MLKNKKKWFWKFFLAKIFFQIFPLYFAFENGQNGQKRKKNLGENRKMAREALEILLFLWNENSLLNSKDFINVLEQKFNLPGLVADEKLFGGGMHESR